MHVRWCLITLISAFCLAGCQSQSVRPAEYFEAAETAYRAGQYEIAHQHYTIFLKQNPDPQLRRLAERRILAIEREIECVLGQKSGPRPAYVNHDSHDTSQPAQHPRVLYKSERPVRLPFTQE